MCVCVCVVGVFVSVGRNEKPLLAQDIVVIFYMAKWWQLGKRLVQTSAKKEQVGTLPTVHNFVGGKFVTRQDHLYTSMVRISL